jgi:hypothetical protein
VLRGWELTIKDGGKDPGFSSMYGKHNRKHKAGSLKMNTALE